jgi:16S rRNA A1518/A1519 N6-dimethyltransferase RsmA/KsgA/DIM1 with predicted DNA glycosylase/AP lyase activity
MPNVDSAVIVIENISKNFFKNPEIDEKRFFDFLKAGFAHKRKLLVNNLEEKIDKNTLKELFIANNIPIDTRAENLSPEMWKKIVGNS